MKHVITIGPFEMKVACKPNGRLWHTWSNWSEPGPVLYGLRFQRWRACLDCGRTQCEYVNEDGSPEVRTPALAKELSR